MTRETKVGLVVGLGVILLIGIIVSDHLSVVQHQQPGTLSAFGGQTQNSLTSMSLSGPNVADQVQARDNASLPPTQNTRGPIEPLPMPEDLQPPAPVRETQVGSDPPIAGNVVGGQRLYPPLGQGTLAGNLPPSSSSENSQPQVIYHSVQRGETLYQIATRHYGNGEEWHRILDANTSIIGVNGTIREGARLTIPPLPAREQARAEVGATSSTPGTPLNTNSASAAPRTIDVKGGDTLSSLAAKHLGNKNRWQELLDANRDQIKRPQDLKLGMKLKLPTPSTSSTTGVTPPVNAAPTSSAVPPTGDRFPALTPASSGGGIFDSAANLAQPAINASSTTTLPATLNNTNSTNSTSPSTAKPRTYTVQKGDTLFSISQKTLGDSKRWKELLRANKTILSDPEDLQIGQQLTIPGQ